MKIERKLMKAVEVAPDLKVEQSDITWLAKEWESLASKVEYPTRPFVVAASWGLLYAFLRGRGIRLGSIRNADKYGMVGTQLTLTVLRRIAGDDAKEIWFPTLVKLGFGTIEGTTEIIKTELMRSLEKIEGPPPLCP